MKITTIEQGLDALKQIHDEYTGGSFTIHWAKKYKWWAVNLNNSIKVFSNKDLIVAINEAIVFLEKRKRVNEKGVKTLFKV